MKKTTLTLWEAFCVLFVLCTHRLMLSPLHQVFAAAGSAAPWWAAAAFLVSLLLFALLLFIPALGRLFLSMLFRALAVVYWLLMVVFALKEGTAALGQTFYPQSPFWFLALFLLGAALVPVLLRRRTVFRLASLLAPPLAVLLLISLIFALPKISPAHFSLPDTWGKGLSLFALSLDWIFLLPYLLPQEHEKKKYLRLLPLSFGFLSAFLLLLLFALLGPVCTSQALPFYTLAKTEPLLLGIYLLALLFSLLLFLMLALHLAVRYAATLSFSKKAKKTLAAMLCLCLCLPLAGCYDNREVEEGAYIMALGIDRGEHAPFLYTFQIAAPGSEDAEGGVTHFTAEAESLSLAMVKLRSFIGKEPDLSHVKAAFFATPVAEEGLETHTDYLLAKTAVSPAAFLCLCENAHQFLEETKPTLEKNMARFYDLLFRSHNSPFAPIVSLYDFSAALKDRPTQMLPVAKETQLAGMGIFEQGALISLQDTPQTVLNLMLLGSARDLPVAAGQSVFSVTAKDTPAITFAEENDAFYACPFLEISLLSGTETDFAALCANLEEGMTDQFRALTAEGLDLLNLKSAAQRSGQNTTDFEENLPKCRVFTKSTMKRKNF